jgi:hypothetical protein
MLFFCFKVMGLGLLLSFKEGDVFAIHLGKWRSV